MKLISIIIPVYNEIVTLETIIKKIQQTQLIENIQKELIVVDDGSTDGSQNIIKNLKDQNIKKIFHEKNMGKGAAIKSALQVVEGEYVLIQDADLEYDPSDYNDLLVPIVNLNADVVFGSRFITGKYRRVLYFRHFIINKMLTFVSNLITNVNLSDMETCYKVIKTDYLKKIKLKERGFGFEPEITVKLSKLMNKNRLKFYETSISYNGRTYEEGKKITWKDGLRAIYCLIKYSFFSK
jgi:glycosyltransferase involved in cell wall biosynthesis